jgi:hypothetical protein
MSSPDAVAKALALAFLAGSWQRPALVRRAREVLGEQPRWLIPLVRHVIARFPDAPNDAIESLKGFRVNHRKTRLMRQAQTQRLVGLVTNRRPNVPRAARERIEAILTNCLKHGLESQNREQNPHFLESLRGSVAWVEHVNPAHAGKLRRLLTACEAAAEPSS